MYTRDRKSRVLRSPSAWLLKGVMALLLMVSVGCLPPAPEQGCFEPYEKVISPTKIQGGKHLYFSINDFDFLSDSKIQIEDISLEATVTNHKRGEQEVSFSLNGLKVSCRDEREALRWSYDKGDRFHAKLHRYFLNGAVSLLQFMVKVKAQKGELRLSTLGDANKNKITEAKLIVRGKRKINCNPPPPPPPPPPVAPKTTIQSVSPSESPTSQSTMAINFVADQSGVQFRCSLDGAAYVPCTSPQNYTGLVSGAHNFRVFAINSAGLSDVAPAEYNWIVDSSAPTVAITNVASLATLTAARTIEFTFAATEPGVFNCRVDGVASACSSPLALSGLSEGPHQFSVTLTDSVGNVSEPAQFQWVVDITAPVTTIVAVTPGQPIHNSQTISFEFQANETSTFECAMDQGAFSACVSPVTLTNLSEGSHWFEVRAVDLAGNRGPSSTYSWLSDFTAPVINVTNTIPAPGLTAARQISVEFSVSENSDVQCDLDGTIFMPCTSPLSAPILFEGPHTLRISSTDAAGNVAVPVEVSWTMDFSAPQISFGAFSPSAASDINTGDFSVAITSSESVTLSATLNGNPLGQFSSPLSLSNLAEGGYSLVISGVDRAGNASNSLTHQFSVDLTAPQIVVQSAAPALTNWDYNTLTFSSNERGVFECDVDGSGYGPCESPLDLSGLADGTHVVNVRATDSAGNISSVASVQWVIDTVAPVATMSFQQTGRADFTFSFSANESLVSYRCSLDGARFQTCSSPVSVLGLSPGIHTFAVLVQDAAGNVGAGASVQVSVAPPVTTQLTSVSPAATVTNSRSATFSFAASQSSATFQCALDGAAPTPCTSPWSGANLADGVHTFRVQAVDSWGAVDPVGATYSWTVDTVAPTVVTINTSASSTSITVTWTTNEPATTKLFWGAGFNPTNVVPETGVLKTSHQVVLTGLSPNTLYSIRPAGTDQAGNGFVGGQISARTAR